MEKFINNTKIAYNLDSIKVFGRYFFASGVLVEIPGTVDLNEETVNIKLVRLPYVKDGLVTLSSISFFGTLVKNTDDKTLIE